MVRAPKVVFKQCRMPLYEFRCPEGHDFEKFYRSIGTAATEEKCPVCGKVAARLMSTAGLVFKGSGFYITDYGKDGKKAEREAASSAASLASSKKEKSESSEAVAKADTPSSESKSAAAESAPAKTADSTAKAAPTPAAAESRPAKAGTPKTNPKKTA